MCGLCQGQAQPPALREALRGDQIGSLSQVLDIRAQPQTLSDANNKVCQNRVVYLPRSTTLSTNAMRLDHTGKIKTCQKSTSWYFNILEKNLTFKFHLNCIKIANFYKYRVNILYEKVDNSLSPQTRVKQFRRRPAVQTGQGEASYQVNAILYFLLSLILFFSLDQARLQHQPGLSGGGGGWPRVCVWE